MHSISGRQVSLPCALSPIFTVLFLFISNVGNSRGLVKLPPNVTIPALLVFGDSIVDSGNNNNLKTVIKCNFPPYGINFQGGTPTGRFCDGRVPSDIIAEELGIKRTLPAYLDPNIGPQELLTGVTFASGGAGYDPLTSKTASVISLSQQLDYFEEYIKKVEKLVGDEQTRFILANSIYLLVAGSDDIANTYYTLRARKEFSVPAYTDLMVNYASNFVQELYKLGARRIGVFSAPPIGCVPSQRTINGGLNRDCAEKDNQAAILFNSKLSAKLGSMRSTLPGSKFVYINVYNPLLDLIQNPQKNGFKVADKGCCGTGVLEVAILCNPYTSTTCSDVSSHIFWDSYHPTERAYKALILPLLNQYIYEFL